MTDFDPTFFENLLHNPSSVNDEVQNQYSGHAPLTEESTKDISWAVVPYKRSVHRDAVILQTDLTEQKRVVDIVIAQWYKVYTEGKLKMTRSQIEERQSDPRTRHVCNAQCNNQKLVVAVYWPPSNVTAMTGSKRHVCCAQICELRNDTTLHDAQHIAWKYDRLYGCEFSGVIHHCIKTNSSGCDGQLTRNNEGFNICSISGFEYSGILVHEKTDLLKGSREQSGMEVTHYSMEREVRAVETRIAKRARESTKDVFGTSVPIIATDIPDKNRFANLDEFSLYQLRKTLWELFFGQNQRVEKEMQEKVLMILEIRKDVQTLYNQKRPVLQSDLNKAVYKHLKKEKPYFAIVSEMDRVIKNRFVNYYAIYCFFIWQYVINHWDRVVAIHLANDYQKDVYLSAVGPDTSKEIVVVKDVTKGNKGDLILINCALATLRHISDQHQVLKLIMPPLNVIEHYPMTTRSSTFTLNMLKSFFAGLNKGLFLEQNVSIPTIPWEEIAKMERMEKYDEVEEANRIRKMMEESLQVKWNAT